MSTTMLSPNQIAETLHKVLLEDTIKNAIFEGNNLVPVNTPNYNKVCQTVKETINAETDLTGKYKDVPTTVLLKLAIQGGFDRNLKFQGNSVENFKMISHLLKHTGKNKTFWEEPNLPSTSSYHIATTTKAAAAIVGCRMEMENFSMGYRGGEPEALKEATKIAKILKTSPAFQSELKGLKRFCTLQALYNEQIPQRRENISALTTVAKAIIKKDFEELTTWKGGEIGIEIDSAIKLHLFTGESGAPILDNLVQQELKKIKETHEEIELC